MKTITMESMGFNSEPAKTQFIPHPFLFAGLPRSEKRIPIWLQLFKRPFTLSDVEALAQQPSAPLPKEQTLSGWHGLPKINFTDKGRNGLYFTPTLIPWPMLLEREPELMSEKPALIVQEYDDCVLVGVGWESLDEKEELTT